MDELDVLLGGESSSSDTEIEIMKSRKVIGGMVEKLNLTTQVEPNYFPLIGGYLARRSNSCRTTRRCMDGSVKLCLGRRSDSGGSL